MDEILVKAFWDKEASVWVAESEDIPGFITEAETMEMLIFKIKTLIPELLEENNLKITDNYEITEVPFRLISECSDIAEYSKKSG